MPRRSRAELIAALREDEQLRRNRRLKLEAREKQEQRKRNTRRNALTGSAVLAHAALDASFAAALRDVLDQAVIKPADREILADLLHPGSAPNGTTFDAQGTSSEPPAAQSGTEPPAEQTETSQA
jgi:hypothetical protein